MRKLARYAAGIAAAFTTIWALFTGCAEPRRAVGPAPDFTLTSLDGTSVSLSQFRGTAGVLLHFGTTWCPPCIAEIPTLNSIHDSYTPEQLVILYVDSGEPENVVRQFVQERGIRYTTLLDLDGRVADAYGVTAIPQNILVDRQGQVVHRTTRITERRVADFVEGGN